MSTDTIKISKFDVADYLDSEELIIEYLKVSMEESNDAFINALATVARAKGIAKLAEDTGLGRESLYKTLRPGAKPRLETINKVLHSLGIRLEPVSVNG